jgi:hypothetical protein
MGASWVFLLVAPSSLFSSNDRNHLESAMVYEETPSASCRVRCIQHAIVFLDRTDTVPSLADPRHVVDVRGSTPPGRSPHAEKRRRDRKVIQGLIGGLCLRRAGKKNKTKKPTPKGPPKKSTPSRGKSC